MNPIRIYCDWYSSLTLWGRERHGDSDAPAFNAMVGLSLAATLNCFSLLIMAELVVKPAEPLVGGVLFGVATWVLALATHYLAFRPSTFFTSETEGDEVPVRNPGRVVGAFAYMAASVALLVLLGILRGP